MAAKKNILPKIAKKWWDFNIDPKTLRPIRFSWNLSSGHKEVMVYDSPSKLKSDIYDAQLRRYLTSYYFIFDKANKRIFAYPVVLNSNNTRAECKNAYYSKLNTRCFYMFDENKQIWEIPYTEYCRYTNYNYNERRYEYVTVPVEPRKVSRLSTMNYKIQCQTVGHIRNMFETLYGKDFVYQNTLVTDSDIRVNNWNWICWLNTKGRKYSEKTVKTTDELMNKISPESRVMEEFNAADTWSKGVILESVDGVTVLCYYSHTKETFRQVFNAKTCKLENFIWKNDRWQKSGKLSDWQQINHLNMDSSYAKNNPYDYQFLSEASEYFKDRKDDRRYWYSPNKSLYDTIMNYLSHPVIHQILQLQDKNGRLKMYDGYCSVSKTYGKIPNKGKTLFAKLGINKYQFAHPDVIVYMKWLLGTTNIAHIDNDTWDRCTVTFSSQNTGGYDSNEVVKFLKSHGEFSIDRWINICKLEQIDRAKHQGGYYYNGIMRLYADYYKSLSVINEFGVDISSYPLIFNTKEQLLRYHDDAARSVSSVRNRAQDEKFQMLYYKREKMLENDGTHMITMPKCSSDLVEEGSHLHHCVGGYVNNVANGNTAIYFLRQSAAPNIPWLTVEVRNKSCVQIHGACNAWMGSKDEYFAAVPFLVYWFNKHGIEYNENLLTNTATGYTSCSSRRNMPFEAIEQYKKNKKK